MKDQNNSRGDGQMKLYEAITPENWKKGNPEYAGVKLKDNKACAVTRAYMVYDSLLTTDVLRRLDEAARAHFPERLSEQEWMSILRPAAAVNDHPDTTIEDVLRMCKFADV
jgi:hypothetical protein